MIVIGVDLAWGDKMSDGLCVIRAEDKSTRIERTAYTHGDQALLDFIREHVGRESCLICIDGPVVCPNLTGTRPVDRMTHRLFHRQHAACHPANLTRVSRPARVGRLLEEQGFSIGWKWNSRRQQQLVVEVYPHPAIVRFFELERIIKYKKGRIAQRQVEFRRYQRLLRRCLTQKFPELVVGKDVVQLLKEPWTKPIEDRTDGVLCALVGLWHWMYRGKKSQVLGDLETGFILLPA